MARSTRVRPPCSFLALLLLRLHSFPAKRQGASVDKLQFKAAKGLPLDGVLVQLHISLLPQRV